jgi:hypothetical protein
MPISYLDSFDPPKTEVTTWLSWTDKDYKKIEDGNTLVAALMGIAGTGDVQILYKPLLVKNEQGEPLAFVGNASHVKSEPHFIYLDIESVGNYHLIEKPLSIPSKLCPANTLPTKSLKNTVWENSKSVCICLVKASIYDDDFVDCMSSISSNHKIWAELMVEILNQEENNSNDIETVIQGPIKKLKKNDSTADYILPTGYVLSTPYFFTYQLRSPTKWPAVQKKLSDNFEKKSNTDSSPSSQPTNGNNLLLKRQR